jgi:long-chain acyl-CoA synthetase
VHPGVFAAKEPERPVSGAALGEHPDIPGHWLRELFGMTEGDMCLSPAP